MFEFWFCCCKREQKNQQTYQTFFTGVKTQQHSTKASFLTQKISKKYFNHYKKWGIIGIWRWLGSSPPAVRAVAATEAKKCGNHPCHNQTHQAVQHTGPGLPTPSQFDILNNYWICHQTKLTDTKSCVNLWLLPLNYAWLHELFMKRKYRRKETTANKRKTESWK